MPTVYLNGNFVPKSHASLSVEDRGTHFADGVYEVIRYYDGVPLAMEAHLRRLRQSLDGIRLAPPEEMDRLPELTEQLLEQNGLRDARIYWQITRGAAPRAYPIPSNMTPTVLGIAAPVPALDPQGEPAALTAILAPDVRWSCCWIKSLMLLPNMLAHNQALDAGADAALFHRDQTVTEATSANIFAVHRGVLRTHPADQWILGGITRDILLDLAGELSMDVCERAVSVSELLEADEVLLTGTTTHVAAVTHIDSQPIGDGVIGPVTRRLHQALVEHIAGTCLSA